MLLWGSPPFLRRRIAYQQYHRAELNIGNCSGWHRIPGDCGDLQLIESQTVVQSPSRPELIAKSLPMQFILHNASSINTLDAGDGIERLTKQIVCKFSYAVIWLQKSACVGTVCARF